MGNTSNQSILQNQTRNQERDRIVFLENIDKNTALGLTTSYPNLMMFTNGYTLSDYNENEEYHINTRPIVGSHIIFNGIPYTIVQGIHPTQNSLNVNGENISLWMDDNGLLRLTKTKVLERYFYVGPFNPLNDIYEDNQPLLKPIEDETNKYQASKKITYTTFQKLFTEHGNEWDFVNQTTYQESGSVNEFLIDGYTLGSNTFNDYYIGNNFSNKVYMIIPVDFMNNIFVSNTLFMSNQNNSTDNKFIPKLQLIKSNIKLDDECRYNIYSSESYTNYDYIRVYDASTGNKNMNII